VSEQLLMRRHNGGFHMTTDRRNQRGIALIMVALFMVVILGFTVLGIDVARLAYVASEVQSVADAAARGGAKALMDVGGTPGVGITRAQAIAAENFMNGHAADPNVEPTQVVAVDEGHWVVDDEDTGEGHFACCTNNTPCCQGGSGLGCGGPGTLSCDRRTAVLAEPSTPVDNLLAGIFNFIDGGRIAVAAPTQGAEQTTVQKLAIAGPTGPSGGCQLPEGVSCGNDWSCFCNNGIPPCLPIAVASCEFQPPNCNGVGCSLPTISMGPDGSDTAAFTGFTQGHSNSDVVKYINQGPCGKKNQEPIPGQDTGDLIDMSNGLRGGSQNQPFGLTACVAGIPTKGNSNTAPQGCKVDSSTGKIIPGQQGAVFQIPIFEATDAECAVKFTDHSAPIVGFATIEITDVQDKDMMTFKVLRNVSETHVQGGGGCFGFDCRVTMTR
jgi:hypothetical protein